MKEKSFFQTLGFSKPVRIALAFALLLVGSVGFYACQQKKNLPEPTVLAKKEQEKTSSRPPANQLTIVQVAEAHRSTTNIIAGEQVETVTFVRNGVSYQREFYIKFDSEDKIVELTVPTKIFDEAGITVAGLEAMLADDGAVLICAQFCRGFRTVVAYVACRAACFIINGNEL